MTDNETETEPNEPEVEPEQNQTEVETNPNAEAAKWRTKLRETEGERDTLTTQLEAARRQIVEAHANLRHPAALWEVGTTTADLFTEDGDLDRDRLNQAVSDAADRLGLARPAVAPHIGKNNGPATSDSRFADAFRPRDR